VQGWDSYTKLGFDNNSEPWPGNEASAAPMRRLATILGLAVLLWVILAAYQIGACELANLELQDDMQDLASQLGTRIGYSQLANDEDLRNAVVRKAQRYDIPLDPSQVTVEHIGSGYTSTVHLAADYTTQVHVPGLTFVLHFTPETGKNELIWRTHGTIVALWSVERKICLHGEVHRTQQ